MVNIGGFIAKQKEHFEQQKKAMRTKRIMRQQAKIERLREQRKGLQEEANLKAMERNERTMIRAAKEKKGNFLTDLRGNIKSVKGFTTKGSKRMKAKSLFSGGDNKYTLGKGMNIYSGKPSNSLHFGLNRPNQFILGSGVKSPFSVNNKVVRKKRAKKKEVWIKIQ